MVDKKTLESHTFPQMMFVHHYERRYRKLHFHSDKGLEATLGQKQHK